MSETYSKLFHSILQSTIWAEDLETKVLWVTMLALADRHGYVGASIPGLAHAAGVSIEATERAIEKFKSPDPYSRSHDFEGRRIEEADRGWVLLNYERFRDMRDEEARREYERNRKREQRKKASSVPDQAGQSRDVPHSPLRSAHTEEYEQEERKATAIVDPSPQIPLLPMAATAAAVGMRAEMEWRVEEVWTAHLKQWAGFFTTLNGKVPKPAPTLTKEIRGAIRDAIATYDGHLLGAEKREEWKRESKARAAGIGIYFDAWCTGADPRNNVAEGGKRFLEHWRPWKKQAGKGDPVERFSELYFDVKSRAGR